MAAGRFVKENPMLPTTVSRVAENTPEDVNERIRRETDATVLRYASLGPVAIERRLAELDEEWDVERYLETAAPTFTLLGLTLGLTVNRKWFVVPALVQSFLLQHALQGWCPPIPVLRRLGVRTASEIDAERCALKALRGDFREVAQPTGHGENINRAREVLDSVRT
jgi:hypothetical protein